MRKDRLSSVTKSATGNSSKAHGTGEPAQTNLALVNFDILSNIFQYFNAGFDSDEGQESREHLYWAALASKAFLDPALDYLWRSMNQLLPLIKLLPAFKVVNNVHVSQVEPRANSY